MCLVVLRQKSGADHLMMPTPLMHCRRRQLSHIPTARDDYWSRQCKWLGEVGLKGHQFAWGFVDVCSLEASDTDDVTVLSRCMMLDISCVAAYVYGSSMFGMEWRRVDSTQDVYILSFVCRLRRGCFQTLSSLPTTDDVMVWACAAYQ